jgi:outer membrane protein assembly factor BamB
MLKTILFIISLLLPIVIWAQTTGCWPNSRGNQALTGLTPVQFPQKIKLKWTFDAEGIFKSAPVVCDGKIVVGSTSGEMLCLDMKGKLIWKFKTPNAIEAPAIIHNNTIYFGNLTGILYAMDLKTGAKKWEYKTENQIMGAPALFISGNKEILAVGSYDYYLHGVDAKTGKGLWKYESENFLNGAPAVSEGKAVFGGCDGFLHSVDLLSGKASSKITVATYVASSPAVEKTRAYVGDYDGGFTAIDLKTNKIIWRYEDKQNTQPFIASPALVGNRIVIGSRDKMIYCFNKTDGKLLWKRNTGNRVEASAVVNQKQALVVNMRGDLMLLNLNDGKTVWTYELGTSVMNTPAVTQEGIVVAASDGNIYYLSQ